MEPKTPRMMTESEIGIEMRWWQPHFYIKLTVVQQFPVLIFHSIGKGERLASIIAFFVALLPM